MSFEGKTVLDVLELSHVMQRDHNVSLTEYYAMTPWMLFVKLTQIERDLDEEAERARRRNASNQWT